MRIVYKVKFENDGVTISQDIRGGPGDEGGGGQDPIGGGGQDPIGGGGQDPIGGGGQDPIGGGGQDPIGGGGQDPIGGGGQDPIGGGGPGRQIAVIFGPVVISSGGAPSRRPSIPPKLPETTKEQIAGMRAASSRPRAPGKFGAIGPIGPIGVNLLCQTESNWCWAAVSAAIRDSKQCFMANSVLGRRDCCTDGDVCNTAQSLRVALGDALDFMLDGTVTFEAIRSETKEMQRPLCARIAWDPDGDRNEDGAHFVVIDDCVEVGGIQYVSIKDPDGGRGIDPHAPPPATSSLVPFEEFRTRYKTSGVWTTTYLLK